jgi:hypothetical protein
VPGDGNLDAAGLGTEPSQHFTRVLEDPVVDLVADPLEQRRTLDLDPHQLIDGVEPRGAQAGVGHGDPQAGRGEQVREGVEAAVDSVRTSRLIASGPACRVAISLRARTG